MFEKFTERAKKVIAFAKTAAEHYRHESLDTEHLLFGILKEGTGRGVKILEKMEIDTEGMKRHIENNYFAKEHSKSEISAGIPFSDMSKKVLATAIFESKNRKHNHVGTEHFLLALIRETEGRAAVILQDFDVKYSSAKKMLPLD